MSEPQNLLTSYAPAPNQADLFLKTASLKEKAATRSFFALRPVGRILSALLGCGVLLGLAGCGTLGSLSIAPTANPALSGHVHGGQQPVSGAHLYLYAASTSANAGAATSLLTSPGYATTDDNGNFSITGNYTCPVGAYVYLLAVGGNPGLAANTNNPDLALAAGLGPCSALTSSSFFTVNEVTTVAAAYSLAAFANSDTQIGATDTTALGNAFANIPNLIDPAHGTALTTTPSGNGVVPQAKIDSLANSLASCINSDGTGTPCSALMAAANVVSGGATPVDTFQAALNIVHNPTANVATLYNLATPTSPFQPILSSVPADWTIMIQYSTVMLTPSSATVAQAGQQGFTASVTGGTAASYQWATSGTVGLLNEVGGAGQTNQTSYCSTSAQATYIPNATSTLTANAADTVTVQAFTGTGCIAANQIGTSTVANVTVTPPTADLVLPGFVAHSLTATIVLPPGSTLTPDKLTVVNSVTQATPAANGIFTIPAYDFGPQIAIVESPSGSPMLMGWLDSTHTTVSAGTTAEILAYYALGGPEMFNLSDRLALEAAILNAPGLPALTQEIATEIGGNSEAFAGLDPALQSALNTFFTSVSGVTPQISRGAAGPHAVLAKPRAGSGGGSSGTGILINPGEQSGLNVLQVPPTQADVTNGFRRLSHAFVQRISDTPTGTPPPADVPDPLDITDFDVSAVTGLTGGVTGTISDIYNFYWGNKTAAYAPTTSSPFSIPLINGYAKTTYLVTVVGPGSGNAALFGTLTDAQAHAQIQVSVAGFVTDALVPFSANFLFGSGFPPGPFSASSTIQVQAFEANWKTDLENDFLGALTTAPDIQSLITSGDYGGALASVVDSVRTSGTFRNVLTTSIASAASKGWAPAGATAGLTLFTKFLGAAGGALEIFDASVYAEQLASSDSVDQWTVVAGGQKVTLSPAATSMNQFGLGIQELTAAAPGVDDTSGFSYFWTNTGLAGDISPVSGGATSTPNSGFCSSSSQVNYVARSVPILAKALIDTITVQVFSSGSCTAANLLGSAPPATITVTLDGVTLSPPSSTIPQTGQTPLTAVINGATGSNFSYKWTLTSVLGSGVVGTLNEVGGTGQVGLSYCSTSAQATYVPNASPALTQNATDAVTVQAFSGTGCVAANFISKSSAAGITVTAAGLLITPRNTSVPQNTERSLGVTLTGAASGTTYSYQWTLTGSGGGATAGTLNEVGGTGQTGVSFCSPSVFVNYIPNPTPAITSPATDIVTAQAFTGTTCATANAVSGAVSTTVTVNLVPTINSLPLSNAVVGVLQASDGNYYGSSGGQTLNPSTSPVCTYNNGGNGPCGALYRIAPDGAETLLYAFPTSGASGYLPGRMIEGPDGNLYGLTADGQFFQVSLSGHFTILRSSLAADLGVSTANSTTLALKLILGSDGGFYFPFSNSIYRLDTSGNITQSYALVPYESCGGSGNNPVAPQILNLVEGADGAFYGTTGIGCSSFFDDYGSIFRVAPDGTQSIFAQFLYSYSDANSDPLVQGFDGAFYGAGSGGVYRATQGFVGYLFMQPQITQPQTYWPDVNLGGLTLGSDGNFYGHGGAVGSPGGAEVDSNCNVSTGVGCFFEYQVTPGGAYQTLHYFQGGTDGQEQVLPGTFSTTGVNIQNSAGALVGSTYTQPTIALPNLDGTIYQIGIGMPPPIQLSFTANPITANTAVTLNWNVLHAFSLTAQQCYAFVQNGATAAGVWSGQQIGVVSGSTYAGSKTITPTAPGTYTYALTCGGTESGFATLVVH